LGYTNVSRRFRMPRAVARQMYGLTLKSANESQYARRLNDNFMSGTGRYSRRLRSYGRRMYKKRPVYRRYGGRGLYSGTGGFWSDAWNASSGLRGFLGGAARASSNPILSGLGRAAGALGIGAYETAPASNEIVDGGQGNPAPTFSSGGGEMGTIQISHKEYVADVFGPESAGVFQNLTYGINPALPGTFPWLSQLAANYEEYTIKQLIFTFRSTVTDFVASNGQVGTVLMATQYNANDAPFASKSEMLEYAGAASCKVSQPMLSGVECDPAQLSGSQGKYTRSGPVPPDEDIKTYDVGTLNIATSNTPAQFNNQAIGELWVSYTVELRKPKFFVTRAQQLLTDLFIGDAPAATTLGLVPWGVGQQNRIQGNLFRSFGAAYPAVANTIYYVFPATFSGNIELSISGTMSASGEFVSVVNPGPAPATTGPPGLIPIRDIWENGAWNYNVGSTAGPVTNVSQFKGHWKVVSPTTAATAVDNVLTIVASGSLSDFRISVTMYNTGLNYARVDRPIMSNPATEQVIEFPAGVGAIP
jgi:hypothetical protein